MLTTEQKKQFSDLFEDLTNNLDITQNQYDNAVTSYMAIGEQLSKEGSLLKPYQPRIRPQGSFMLGTMIKPVNEEDDLDIDLICELTGKKAHWTQFDLKKIVGDQLAANETYKDMLKYPDGKRCWTLEYRKGSIHNREKYHMDVLPSIVNSEFYIMLAESRGYSEAEDWDSYAIRITDKTILPDYHQEIDHLNWLKSNPIGYGKWFFMRASLTKEIKMFNESIDPVPRNNKRAKLPLQRAVQILKRHRDIMFVGDEAKPISIIITTLAAKAYGHQSDLFETLTCIVEKMESFIEERPNPSGKIIKWIPNPVNDEENFADRWETNPERQENFYKWLKQVKQDVQTIINSQGKGLQWINESMSRPFGDEIVRKMFSDYGQRAHVLREAGKQTVATTGFLGASGMKVQDHKFDGSNE
jgi:hypothetical protein